MPLGFLFALLPYGCYLSPPPEPEELRQTPPFIQSESIVPLAQVIQDVHQGDPFNVTFKVRSEDLDQPLRVLGIIDDRTIVDTLVLPGHFDEPRDISLSWTVDADSGCHRFTVLVTHNVNLQQYNPPLLFDETDKAEVHFWLNVNDDGPSTLLADCNEL